MCKPLHHGSDIKRDSEALSLSTCADLLLAKVSTDSLEPQRSLNTLRWRRPVSVNCAMKRGRYWIRAAAEHQTARQAVESLSLSLPATEDIIIPLERLVMRRQGPTCSL